MQFMKEQDNVFAELPGENAKAIGECINRIKNLEPARVADYKDILIELKKALDEKLAGM